MNEKIKQSIIERWRKTGFMNGIKNNTPNEWRMAYSFNLLAMTLFEFLSDEEYQEKVGDKLLAAQTYAFPIVRDCLTTKNRITHTILPEQVLWPLLNLTFEELFDVVGEKNPKFKKRIDAHNKIHEFLKINNDNNSLLIDILIKYEPEDETKQTKDNVTLTLDIFKRLTNIDLVPWLLTMVSDFIKAKSYEFDEGLLPWEEEIPYKKDEENK